MARTVTEQREYSRGYQRGTRRSHDYASFAFRMAKLFRKQASDLRLALLGKDNWTARECRTCERWSRGCATCKWGICSADFLAEAGEPMMWTEGGQITTHEDFGCCNHLASNPLRRTLKTT